jgi:hypothetical protein
LNELFRVTCRAVAQVALVDEYERVLLNFYVKPEEKTFRYDPLKRVCVVH